MKICHFSCKIRKLAKMAKMTKMAKIAKICNFDIGQSGQKWQKRPKIADFDPRGVKKGVLMVSLNEISGGTPS